MQNAANDAIVEHVESGRDVRVEGAAASARLDAVGARLENRFNVVRLAAPLVGLSLSALIAQLSGRERFDEQDDGALEAGFRRLSGADAPGRRTVLLLDATHGVQRPVLRYLQQVGRNAPELQIVIAAFPELTAFLDAPDMLRLRGRLQTVVDAGVDIGVAAPAKSRTLPPPAARSAVPFVAADTWTIEARRRASTRKQRRSRRVALIWTVSGLAMAASVALGAWLGQAKMMPPQAKPQMAVTEPARHAQLTLAPVPAHLGAPPLAAKVVPAPASLPTQAAGVVTPTPALAKLIPPEAVASGEPPAAVAAKPDPVIVASAEERPTTARPRANEAHRVAGMPIRPRIMVRSRIPAGAPADASRYTDADPSVPFYGAEELPPEEPVAPARGRGQVARGPMGGYYGRYRPAAAPPLGDPGAPPSVEPAPRGAQYEPPSDEPYIGTFSTGPYGARLFRYGP